MLNSINVSISLSPVLLLLSVYQAVDPQSIKRKHRKHSSTFLTDPLLLQAVTRFFYSAAKEKAALHRSFLYCLFRWILADLHDLFPRSKHHANFLLFG